MVVRISNMRSRWFTGWLIAALVLGLPSFACAADHETAKAGALATGAVTSAPWILLTVYCLLIALSSMFGGLLPTLIRLTHERMQYLVSLIGGLMLGVGIFHQLPHAVAAMTVNGHSSSFALDWCMGWLMFGLLLTFFMLRMFHFHNHDVVDAEPGHTHDCDHDHDSGKNAPHVPVKGASWIGIFLGLSLHTLLDGVALAANVQADALHNHNSAAFTLLGVGTFLGVVLHKPLDSMSIASIMTASGWSIRYLRIVNVGYALMCPIGAAMFFFGMQRFTAAQDVIVASALAMSAGVFICISLSDLLPEVQFHSHDRMKLSAVLLIGVFVAWLLGYAEPGHTHGHPDAPTDQPGQIHAHEHQH